MLDCEEEVDGGSWPPKTYNMESRTIEQWSTRAPALLADVDDGGGEAVPVAEEADAPFVASLRLKAFILFSPPTCAIYPFVLSTTAQK